MRKQIFRLVASLFFILVIFSAFSFMSVNKAFADSQGFFCSKNGSTIWQITAQYCSQVQGCLPSIPINSPVNQTANVNGLCGSGYDHYFTMNLPGYNLAAGDTVNWSQACVDPSSTVVSFLPTEHVFRIDISCYTRGSAPANGEFDRVVNGVHVFYAGCGTNFNNLGTSIPANGSCTPPTNSQYCTYSQGTNTNPCNGGSCSSTCTLTGNVCNGGSCVSGGNSTPNSPLCVGKSGCECINNSDCKVNYCGTGSNSCNQYNGKCVSHKCVIDPTSPTATNTVACNGVNGASCPVSSGPPPGPGTISNPQGSPFCQGTVGTNRAAGITFTWTAVSGATTYNVVYSGVNHSTNTNSLTIPTSSCVTGPGSCSFSYNNPVQWYVTTTVGGTTYTSTSVTTTTNDCTAAPPPTCPAGQADPHYACATNACISVAGCGVSTCTGPSDTTSCGGGGGGGSCTTCNGPTCVSVSASPCISNCAACSGGVSCP